MMQSRSALAASLAACWLSAASWVSSAHQYETTQAPFSCLVLDVEGGGVKLVGPSSGVLFDVDGRGKDQRIGWIAAGADDAFLVVDRNDNGRVDDGTELISNRFPLPDGRTLVNGLRVLIALQDGVMLGPDGRTTALPPNAHRLDAEDPVYSRMFLWTDSNHDGKSSPTELRKLPAADISSISTGMRGAAEVQEGNEIFMTGWFLVLKRGVELRRTMVEVRLHR
jgi:hypothetical protein